VNALTAEPILAAAGYSLVHLLLGAGTGGAVLILLAAKLLRIPTLSDTSSNPVGQPSGLLGPSAEPGDVGRPITDIACELAYPALADQAREVLRTLVVHEQPAAAQDGRWFKVRILPYRTLDNMIDGLVLTFADLTVSKTLEQKLRLSQSGMERHIAEQDVKLEQSGEALQAEIQRGQTAAAPGGPGVAAQTKATTP
jgi:hypothetical protein